MIAAAAVGCKPMLGRRFLESRREYRSQVSVARQWVPQFPQYGIQRRKRDLGGCGDLNPDGLAIFREIDDQTRFDPPGSNALLIGLSREIVVRGDGFPIALCAEPR
jgi:hypothetical protein